MGSSLGYGQGTEYQYFNAPQPSQPIQQLRQARLLQLREARLRRQQQRMQPGTTSLTQRKGAEHPPVAPPSGGYGTPQAQPPAQMSPPVPPGEFSAVPSFKSPPNLQHSPSALPIGVSDLPQSSAYAAQDTGMIQRARIGRATLILTGSFVASRILGLLRTSMFAYVFGTTHTSDAFLQAFLVPDLIFNLIAGGALGSAFIPVFTQYMVGERDEKSAWHIASSALNIAIAIMIGLALLAIIFASWIVPLYNPGLHDQQELNLIISLSRIMFLQAIILGAGVVITSVLNAKQHFLLPAIGTVLYNVGLILGLIPGLLLVAHRTPASETTAVYFATIGVVLGAILQVGVQIPGIIKAGMRYSFTFDWRHPGVLQIGRLMVPRIINAAMLYISIFVDRSLILLMAAGAGVIAASGGFITQYYQAFQLLLLPLGIFGMAVSTAAFPTLAENVARGRIDQFRNIIQDTLRTILFMSIPSSIGLIVLGLPIIQVLLEHGAYSLQSATYTSIALAFFAIGLPGLAAVEILTRSFYALRDSKTPVIVSVTQFIFKIALSLLLIQAAGWGLQWGLAALALATSIAGLLEAFVILWLLQERLGNFELRKLGVFATRVLLAALAMGFVLLIVRFLLDLILPTTNAQGLGVIGTIFAIFKLLIELAVGLLIYIRATRLLGIEEFWRQGPVKRVLERLRLSWI
jgi:putative peptidoglycan lipid II flippase